MLKCCRSRPVPSLLARPPIAETKSQSSNSTSNRRKTAGFLFLARPPIAELNLNLHVADRMLSKSTGSLHVRPSRNNLNTLNLALSNRRKTAGFLLVRPSRNNLKSQSSKSSNVEESTPPASITASPPASITAKLTSGLQNGFQSIAAGLPQVGVDVVPTDLSELLASPCLCSALADRPCGFNAVRGLLSLLQSLWSWLGFPCGCAGSPRSGASPPSSRSCRRAMFYARARR